MRNEIKTFSSLFKLTYAFYQCLHKNLTLSCSWSCATGTQTKQNWSVPMFFGLIEPTEKKNRWSVTPLPIKGYTKNSGLKIRVVVTPYWRATKRAKQLSMWLRSRSVLSSFGVGLMSCKVNFHVVRSALQYSACRIYVYLLFLLIRSL